jgi:SPP1 gp7 family putative phage head morphogenesis protein
MTLRKGERVLKPVRPNAGIAAIYRRRIDRLLKEMACSYVYWLRAQYQANPPKLASDESPAQKLQRELNRLGLHWGRRWGQMAPRLARYFATAVEDRARKQLRDILREGGASVEFRMTAAMRDVFKATVQENVSLIRSIPEQFHTQVEGLVMRSVQSGRDIGQLTKDLQKRYGVSYRRAALIARDQNNKATSTFQRVRCQELGIEEAIWLHSHAGKKPRPTHKANDGKRYKIAEGWFDPDPKIRQRIWPGQLINCRCTAKPIVKGFS